MRIRPPQVLTDPLTRGSPWTVTIPQYRFNKTKQHRKNFKEAQNLDSAGWGCYPQLSGRGSNLIKKVPMIERLPWRMSTIEHQSRQLLHAESPVPARGVFNHPARAENSKEFLVLLEVAKGIVIFRTLSLCSISNESISSLSFSCGHDLRDALEGVGKVNAG